MVKKFVLKVGEKADYLVGVTFMVMVCGVVIAVFGRYLFRYPVPGGMELAYFAMLWCAFLATGNALAKGKHVSMSLLIDKLQGKTRIVFDLCIGIIILICTCFMVWWSSALAYEAMVMNLRDSGSLGMPLIVLYGMMVLGSIFLGIVAISKIIGEMEKLGGKSNGR